MERDRHNRERERERGWGVIGHRVRDEIEKLGFSKGDKSEI